MAYPSLPRRTKRHHHRLLRQRTIGYLRRSVCIGTLFSYVSVVRCQIVLVRP